MVLTACSSDNGEEPRVKSEEFTDVVLTFSPYEQTAMTRTAVSIADVVNHLDVWVVNGSDVIASHTTSTDAGFGTVSMTLDKTKTYTLYAVGHKADGATFSWSRPSRRGSMMSTVMPRAWAMACTTSRVTA